MNKMNKMSALRFTSLAALVSVVSCSAMAENYALIMGVSAYERKPLFGVKTDVTNVRKIARAMNIPDANVTVKEDKALTLQGIRQTLDEFASKIRQGDRAFIYFSGHGTSYPGAAGQCEQAIVSQEIKYLTKKELHDRLKPIVDKAAKTFVFLDTCFSGGVIESSRSTTRGDDEGFPAAKFMESKFGAESTACEPTNVSHKGTRDFEAEAAEVTPNYYFLAASAPSQVAIDGGTAIGGWATSAFFACTAAGSGADENGDGVITLDEAKRCAQKRVDQMMANGQRRPGFPYTALTLTDGSGPGAGAWPVAFEATVPAANAPTAATPAAANINSNALLATIVRDSDASNTVKVQPAKSVFKIGSDFLQMTVSSAKAGFVTLFSVGSSGKIFQLFPNRFDSSNRIEAGVPLALPRPEWRLRSRGPEGTSKFLAVVSTTPDRFAGLGLPEGPFSAIENTQQGAKTLVVRLLAPGAACSQSTRDFEAEANPCATGYGAGLAEVREAN
jgi:hypothetical protein